MQVTVSYVSCSEIFYIANRVYAMGGEADSEARNLFFLSFVTQDTENFWSQSQK